MSYLRDLYSGVMAKKVTQIPVTGIRATDRELYSRREGYPDKETIRQMLRQGPVEFVVANVGDPLKRIALEDCFEFWKTEAEPHLAENPDRIYLETFPDEYAYLASIWEGERGMSVILLEMYH